MQSHWSVLLVSLSLLSAPAWSDESKEAGEPEKETKCPLVAPVHVDADPKLKAIEMARKNDAPMRVTNAIACELEKRMVTKPFKLQATIVDFRLRSGAAAFWVGAMAGADRMAVEITAQPETGEATNFKVNSNTVQGGMIKPDPRQRINHMAKDLARKIAAQLEASGYIKPQ